MFAPLTNALASHLTWRETYLVLAAALVVVTIPLHAIALRHPWPTAHDQAADEERPATEREQIRRTVRSRPFALLTLALTLSGFAMYAALIALIPCSPSAARSRRVLPWRLTRIAG